MIVGKLINLLSPQVCLVCSKQGQACCADCWQQQVEQRVPACFLCNRLSPNGHTCKTCRAKTKVSGTTVPYRLHNTILESVYQLKYHANTEMAGFLASQIIDFLPPLKFDCISFVPSVGKSQRKRGYNQAKLLAKHISRHTGIALHQKLVRISHTDQIGLDRRQRFEMVENNFLPSKNCSGETILLVDDVITTGATVSECAKVLKEAGAKRVWVLAVAKK